VQESVFSEDADSAGMSLAALGQKRVGKECFMQASSRLTLNSASVALLFSLGHALLEIAGLYQVLSM
jgi:hypothetical protein